MSHIPAGIITIWFGAIVDIPSGWALCDGNNGTPDLRNKFIPGAGEIYAPGDAGGADVHTHQFTGNGHNHGIPVGMNIAGGSGFANSTSVSNSTGTTDNGSSLPPFYALAYIMAL